MARIELNPERSRKRRKLSPSVEDDTPAGSVTVKSKSKSENGTVEKTDAQDEKSATSSETVLPSVKDLASSEASTRRAAMKNISKHLEDRPIESPLSTTECLQLWRGFFVATYMHDSKNALSVQNLLKEIAGTFELFAAKDDERHKEGTDLNSDDIEFCFWLEPYHATFWQTLVKEWAGIDSHRMNKYLLLVRFVVKELALISLRPVFRHWETQHKSKPKAKKRKPSADLEHYGTSWIIDSKIRVLQGDGPLNTTDRKIPDGLRLHMLDVYVDELFNARTACLNTTEGVEKMDESHASATRGVLLYLRYPITKMAESTSGLPKNVRMKAKEALAEFDVKFPDVYDVAPEL